METYVYIRKWGQYMGSNSSYIEQEIYRARADNAPPNAINERSAPGGGHTGQWATTDDITNPVARHALGLPSLEEPTP